jgi:hypothetical protein
MKTDISILLLLMKINFWSTAIGKENTNYIEKNCKLESQMKNPS